MLITIKKCLFALSLVLFLVGCGSDSSSSTSSSGGSQRGGDTTTKETVSKEFNVERGPVYDAKVQDAKGQFAVANERDGYSNTYVFDETPKLPITVKGGFIDTNANNKVDEGDIVPSESKLSMTTDGSGTNFNITPITTEIRKMAAKVANLEDKDKVSKYVATSYERLKNLISEFAPEDSKDNDNYKVTVEELGKLPSSMNEVGAMIASSALYGASLAIADDTTKDKLFKIYFTQIEEAVHYVTGVITPSLVEEKALDILKVGRVSIKDRLPKGGTLISRLGDDVKDYLNTFVGIDIAENEKFFISGKGTFDAYKVTQAQDVDKDGKLLEGGEVTQAKDLTDVDFSNVKEKTSFTAIRNKLSLDSKVYKYLGKDDSDEGCIFVKDGKEVRTIFNDRLAALGYASVDHKKASCATKDRVDKGNKFLGVDLATATNIYEISYDDGDDKYYVKDSIAVSGSKQTKLSKGQYLIKHGGVWYENSIDDEKNKVNVDEEANVGNKILHMPKILLMKLEVASGEVDRIKGSVLLSGPYDGEFVEVKTSSTTQVKEPYIKISQIIGTHKDTLYTAKDDLTKTFNPYAKPMKEKSELAKSAGSCVEVTDVDGGNQRLFIKLGNTNAGLYNEDGSGVIKAVNELIALDDNDKRKVSQASGLECKKLEDIFK